MTTMPPSEATPPTDRDRQLAAAFDAYFDDLYRFSIRRVGDGLAEDAVAETFTRALARYSSFDPRRGELRAWLFGIASNVARELARSARRDHAPADCPSLVGSSASDEVDRLGEDAELKEALALLSSRDAEILLLTDGLGFPYREAGLAIGVPIGTVRSRLALARRHLRRALLGGAGESERKRK